MGPQAGRSNAAIVKNSNRPEQELRERLLAGAGIRPSAGSFGPVLAGVILTPRTRVHIG
jgi:hypothetical protein